MTPVVAAVRGQWVLRTAGEPGVHEVELAVADGRFALRGPGAPNGATLDGAVGGAVAGAVVGDAASWVIPALADAHDHGRGLPTIAYGAHDEALEPWIAALSLQPAIDPPLLAALALAKLARSGVAGVVHCHNTQDPAALVEECTAVARTAAAIGLRLGLAVPMADRNRLGYGPDESVLALVPHEQRDAVRRRWGAPPPSVGAQLDVVDAIADAVAGLPGIHVQYCPVGPQWCSDELLGAVAEASARTGRRVHTHLFETRLQREWADAAHPDGLVAHLDRLGLLSDRLTVAHGVWLDDTDLAVLAERRVVISVNSTSNLRLRSGVAPLQRFLDHGVRVAVGLDGMSLDDDEDALREVRLAHLLHAGVGLERGVDAATVLHAATCVGPVAVAGEGDWGRLAPGSPADAVVLDGEALGRDLVPGAGHDLRELVVARARARHVRHLVVAGRHVVRDGAVVGVDDAAVAAEVAEQARAAADRHAELRPAVTALQAGLRTFYATGGHRGAVPGRSA
ncbi:MAG: amidohydrolase family protein [Acidimicrobiales bacterium]